MSGLALLLGLRDTDPEPVHHEVLFGPRPYDDEFDALFGRPARLPDEPAIYLCRPDDPTVAPAGHRAGFVLVNAPPLSPGGPDWTDTGRADAAADRVLALLAERGRPLADRIGYRQVITPADLASRTGGPDGAIYGDAGHGPSASFRRPGNATGVAGLFRVGGTVHPGGGLPLVALSAEITAGLIGSAR